MRHKRRHSERILAGNDYRPHQTTVFRPERTNDTPDHTGRMEETLWERKTLTGPISDSAISKPITGMYQTRKTERGMRAL